MANPNWQKGGPSPNPEGRRKMRHSARTMKGKLERLSKGLISDVKFKKDLHSGTLAERIKFLEITTPLFMPKLASVNMSATISNVDDQGIEELWKQHLASIGYADVIEDDLSIVPKQLPEPIKQPA